MKPAANARALRAQAVQLRRAADRISLLRLRITNTFAQGTGSGNEPAREIYTDLQQRWNTVQYSALGTIGTTLRRSAKALDSRALAAERSSGRRLGGYAGAGFLGSGREASVRVSEVVRSIGADHGASIGWQVVLCDGGLAPLSQDRFMPRIVEANAGSTAATPEEPAE